MLFCFLVSPTVHISFCFSLFIPNKMTYLLHSNQLLLNQITNVHPLSINSITYLIDSYQLLFNQIINFVIQFISFLLALYYIYSLYICHSSVWFMVFIFLKNVLSQSYFIQFDLINWIFCWIRSVSSWRTNFSASFMEIHFVRWAFEN